MKLGNSEDVKPCNIHPCDQDGGYSNWNTWSGCSQTCGGGIMERIRHCNNPPPIGKGKTCKKQGLGQPVDSNECNTDPC